MTDPVGALGLYIDDEHPRCQTIPPIPFTNWSWAELFLMNLHAPLTTNNIQNVLRWMVAEGPASNWWRHPGQNNPLDCGEHSGGGDGTGSYVDLAQAAYWSAQHLYRPGRGYEAVRSALMNDASTQVFGAAVIKSNWALGHYGVASAGAGQFTQAGHTIKYISQIPVPPEVTASISRGANVSGANGAGWNFMNPLVWAPKVGPLPPDVDVADPPTDPVNLSELPPYSSDVQPVQPTGGGGGGTTGGGGGGTKGGTSGGTTGGTSGGSTGTSGGGESEGEGDDDDSDDTNP